MTISSFYPIIPSLAIALGGFCLYALGARKVSSFWINLLALAFGWGLSMLLASPWLSFSAGKTFYALLSTLSSLYIYLIALLALTALFLLLVAPFESWRSQKRLGKEIITKLLPFLLMVSLVGAVNAYGAARILLPSSHLLKVPLGGPHSLFPLSFFTPRHIIWLLPIIILIALVKKSVGKRSVKSSEAAIELTLLCQEAGSIIWKAACYGIFILSAIAFPPALFLKIFLLFAVLLGFQYGAILLSLIFTLCPLMIRGHLEAYLKLYAQTLWAGLKTGSSSQSKEDLRKGLLQSGTSIEESNFILDHMISYGQSGCSALYPSFITVCGIFMTWGTLGRGVTLAVLCFLAAGYLAQRAGVLGGGPQYVSLALFVLFGAPLPLFALFLSLDGLSNNARTALNLCTLTTCVYLRQIKKERTSKLPERPF